MNERRQDLLYLLYHKRNEMSRENRRNHSPNDKTKGNADRSDTDSMTIAKEILYSEPIFFSRLGFGYDPPRYDREGRQILFSRNFDFL